MREIEHGHIRRLLLRVSSVALMSMSAAVGAQPGEGGGEGHVVGRIHVVEDDKERTFGELFRSRPFDLFVRSEADGAIRRIALRGDGSFAWRLPPGPHVLAAFESGAPLRMGRIWARFQVPPAGEAASIGTLLIVMQRYGGYAIGLEPAQDDARGKAGATQLPAGVELLQDLPMQLDRLPWRRATVSDICGSATGLTCDRSHHGLRPTMPAGAENAFPAVDSLTPTLQWTPAADERWHYDVAVYERIHLSTALPERAVRGDLVAYFENLAEPRITLDKPLAPGRRYEWSVRLRDGDAVTTWSTTGEFVFLLVAAVSTQGNWFGFSTP